jgi:cytochrome P450
MLVPIRKDAGSLPATGGASPAPVLAGKDMIAWTTAMFWYLFVDLKGDARITAAALDAAAKCRDYLDAAVRDRKRQPAGADNTILSRCLTLQGAGLPGMDDLDIRNNLIGLIPTQFQAAVQALDQLMDRPDALAGAQAAAQADNDALLAKYIFDALRFNPVNPMIYRRAAATTVIARSTLRAWTIPEGTMVLAANLSAMFDPLQVKDPNAFRTDRPAEDYILWGYDLHTCFGYHFNQVVIPAMLKPLLKRKGLRHMSGSVGQVDIAGTPFPAHMVLGFDCG